MVIPNLLLLHQRYEAPAAQLAQLIDMLEIALECWAELAELAE